jgi:hypothetical protein
MKPRIGVPITFARFLENVMSSCISLAKVDAWNSK